MKELTITNFEQLLATIVSIIISLGFIYAKIKLWIETMTKQMDKQQTMDFLVLEFARADRHELTQVEKLRIKERYDHYTNKPEDGGLGGNSYIKEEYERLKNNKRL